MLKRILLSPFCPWVLFLGVSFFTLTRIPYSWMDEVSFAEPAANFVSGRGFVSLGWRNQPPTQMAVITEPLFHALVIASFKVLGVGLLSSRLPGFVLGLTAVLVLGSAGRKAGLLKTSEALAIFFWLALFGYSFFFTLNATRPDNLTMLLSVLGFSCVLAAAENRRWLPLVFLVAVLVPLNGIHLIIGSMLLLGCCWLAVPAKYQLSLLVAAAGLVTGALAFRVGFGLLGLWDEFLRLVRTEGPDNLLARVVYRLTTNPLHHYKNQIPRDYSLFWIGLAAILALGDQLWRRTLAPRDLLFPGAQASRDANRLWRFSAVCLIVLPVGLWLFGKFSTHYTWILCLPLALLAPSMLELAGGAQLRRGLAVCLVLAVVSGVPLQLSNALPDWADRDYARVQSWARSRFKADDVVYCDCPAYFALFPVVGRVYPAHNLLRLPRADIDSIKILVLNLNYPYPRPPMEVLLPQLGGRWNRVEADEFHPKHHALFGNSGQAGLLSIPNYDFAVYRKAGE